MNSQSVFRKKRVTKKEDKVLLQVLIRRDLYEKLVSIAPQLYGATKGALSHAVEEALESWLAPRLHAQVHANPTDKVRMKFRAVLQSLKKVLGLPFVPDEAPLEAFKVAIAQAIGSDPRTINKYLDLFEKAKLIKYLGPNLVEIVAVEA